MISLRKLIKPVSLLFIVALTFTVFVNTGKVSAATSAATLNANIPNARTEFVNEENNCTANLQNQFTNPATRGNPPRTKVNAAGEYAQPAWISPAGQPNQNTFSVPANTAVNLGMQFNEMEFICAVLTFNNNYNGGANSNNIGNYITNNATKVTAGNFPNDRQPWTAYVPSSIGGVSTPVVNSASLTGIHTRVYGASVVSGGGSVTLTGNKDVNLDRDDTSRYWFSSPMPFTYTHAPFTTPGTYNITLQLDAKSIAEFSYSTDQCGVSYVGSLNDFNNPACTISPISITFPITVTAPPAPSWTVTGKSSVSRATAKPGDTVTFDHTLTIRTNKTDLPVNWHLEGNASPVPTTTGVLASGSGVGNHAVNANNFTIPITATNGQLFCQRINFNPTDSFGTGTDASTVACVTVQLPPLTFTCNPITLTPNSVDPTTVYSIDASVTVSPAALATYVKTRSTFYVHVVGPSVSYINDTLVPTVDNATGTLSVSNVTPGATNSSGDYTVTYGLNGLENIDCSTHFFVGYHPYFRVDAGDISAGAGFGATCTSTANAGIIGSGDPVTFAGVGAQLAALATGTLSGFPTSTNDGGSSSGVPGTNRTGLAFSNTPPVGNFISGGGNLPCLDDYAADAAPTGSPSWPAGTVDISDPALSSDTTYVITNPGITHITESAALANDRHITLVINGGTVIVDTNIKYAAYPAVGHAAQFRLIVANGGNIKILPSVSELHGLYVAQGGSLSTCYDTSASPAKDSIDYPLCNNKLTFYGAVAASSLLLERNYGTVHADTIVTAEPSEVFNFTPEFWAANIPQKKIDVTIDSITSLPPVL